MIIVQLKRRDGSLLMRIPIRGEVLTLFRIESNKQAFQWKGRDLHESISIGDGLQLEMDYASDAHVNVAEIMAGESEIEN